MFERNKEDEEIKGKNDRLNKSLEKSKTRMQAMKKLLDLMPKTINNEFMKTSIEFEEKRLVIEDKIVREELEEEKVKSLMSYYTQGMEIIEDLLN